MTAIATLGSHCALQVLKGAKDECLKTILVCEKKREKLYRRFPFIDELILVDNFVDVLEPKHQSVLEQNEAILIPHGTLIAQMSSEQIESIKTPIFGNKWILRWESDRTIPYYIKRWNFVTFELLFRWNSSHPFNIGFMSLISPKKFQFFF